MEGFDYDDGWTTLIVGDLGDETYITLDDGDNVSIFLDECITRRLRDWLDQRLALLSQT